MHDYDYTITFLKTPMGYLTYDGFTDDINSNDLLLLPSNSYGKWTPFNKILEFFGKRACISEYEYKEILANESKCEIRTYSCSKGTYCCNFNNPDCKNKNCAFWNSDRGELKLHRIYALQDSE